MEKRRFKVDQIALGTVDTNRFELLGVWKKHLTTITHISMEVNYGMVYCADVVGSSDWMFQKLRIDRGGK